MESEKTEVAGVETPEAGVESLDPSENDDDREESGLGAMESGDGLELQAKLVGGLVSPDERSARLIGGAAVDVVGSETGEMVRK